MRDGTVCKSYYNKNRRKNKNNTLKQNQQPKNDNVSKNENHAYVVIGPRNVGKTHYMLKMFKKIGAYSYNNQIN